MIALKSIFFTSGNTNLIYSIIRSKAVFYQLANLPEDSYQLVKSHSATGRKEAEEEEEESRSHPQGRLGVSPGTIM